MCSKGIIVFYFVVSTHMFVHNIVVLSTETVLIYYYYETYQDLIVCRCKHYYSCICIGICVDNKTRCVIQNINDKPVEVGARRVERFRPEVYETTYYYISNII